MDMHVAEPRGRSRPTGARMPKRRKARRDSFHLDRRGRATTGQRRRVRRDRREGGDEGLERRESSTAGREGRVRGPPAGPAATGVRPPPRLPARRPGVLSWGC